MGAGLRDAMNLAWKLAGVLDGELSETVLDTYEAERRPHARHLIHVAKLVGVLMTEGGRVGDALRQLIAPRAHLVPGLRAKLLDSTTPSLHRSALVDRPRLGRSLAGTLCPNPVLADGQRLDEVAGGRFAVVSRELSTTQRALVEGLGVTVIEARGELEQWLRSGGAQAALVRPDGTVMVAGSLDRVLDATPHFGRVALDS